MTYFAWPIFARYREGMPFWVLALFLLLSGAWDCYTGQSRWGHWFEFDKDDTTGAFIIVVGLKFVLGVLILLACFSRV